MSSRNKRKNSRRNSHNAAPAQASSNYVVVDKPAQPAPAQQVEEVAIEEPMGPTSVTAEPAKPAKPTRPQASVSVTTAYADTDYKAYPVALRANELLHGALDIDDLSYGWLQPWRFLPAQRQALSSCSAWYPGIYRQMAACTSGMELSFTTNCSFVHIELSVDAFPKASLDVFRGMRGAPVTDVPVTDAPATSALTTVEDDFMLELDGAQPQPVHLDEVGRSYVLEIDFGTSLVGSVHTVRLWLPAMRGVKLRYVCAKGGSSKELYVRPVAYGAQLLVLGDSVAQGFSVTQPNQAWPAVVARELNYELINQSVGGQVFQPAALMSLEGAEALDPAVVVVALGTNYKYGRCMEQMVAREISAYIHKVARLWPKATLLIVAPNKQGVAAVKGSCFERVPALITHAYQAVREQRLKANNQAPVALKTAPELIDKYITDADGHPTAEGSAQLAQFVLGELTKLDCDCYRQTGTFGRCGACLIGEPADKNPLEQQEPTEFVPADGADQQ